MPGRAISIDFSDRAQVMKKVIQASIALIAAISIAGCASSSPLASKHSIASFESEPIVGWSYKLPDDVDELVELFSWQSRDAVVAVSSMDWRSDLYGDYLVEVIDIQTGAVIESDYLSRLLRLETDAEDYRLDSMEDASGNLLISVNSFADSHLLTLGLEETVENKSLTITEEGSYSLFYDEFSRNVIIATDSDNETLTVLGDDLVEIRQIPFFGDDYEFSGFYDTGLVAVDVSSQGSAYYEFIDFLSVDEPRRGVTLPKDSDGDVPQFLAELGENYLFGLAGDSEWELILVSPDGLVQETVPVAVSDSNFGTDFIHITEEKVFLIEEFREDFSVLILDSGLEEVAEVPLDRVDEASFAYQFPEGKSLGKLIILADDSFALFDTSTNEVTRFRALSDRVYYIAGLGFSEDSFFILDRGELVSYDFELGFNWTFRLLDDEKILRAGEHIFLLRADDNQLFILTNE